ncbi:MAG: response regulator [Acidobacteriota bacterium]
MKSPLRILYLEDDPNDAELVKGVLMTEGIICDLVHTDTREAFISALEQSSFDLLLSDYLLPSFDDLSVLQIARQKWPDTPFIYISGTIGEEAAIELLKQGATDYVLKHRLSKLAPAIQRALREAEEHIKRKQAEERLHEQVALLDIVPNAILVRDLENRILFWNKGAERLYGWPAAEVIGKNIMEILYQEDTQPAIAAWHSVKQAGEWTGELPEVSQNGHKIIVDSHLILLRDRNGIPQSVLSVSTDITEKKALEAQFLRAQRMESIGILAGGIAHDLNNVLAPILMGSQVLRGQLTNERGRRVITTIEESAQRGADLVRQILSFARGMDGNYVELNVGHLIMDIQRMMSETFPKSINIKALVAKDLWTLTGNATQIYQVLMNICVNARDAMPQGGEIQIKAENTLIDEHYVSMNREAIPGKFILITIMDTGIGIPAEVINSIFEPFFTTKEIDKGTGLGLSTSLAIVKSHGGFINVYSESGKGTKFTIYLPVSSTIESTKVTSEQLQPLAGHGEMILVVDDEASICEITKATLEAYGYQVVTAKDGTEAVALYVTNKDRIKLVLMDMMMPNLDGPATAKILHKIDPTVKIISGSGFMASTKTVPDTNIQAFLTKPYTADKLLETVAQVLDTKQLSKHCQLW